MNKLFFDPPSIDVAIGITCIAVSMCVIAALATFVSERVRKTKDANLRQRCLSAYLLTVLLLSCTYAGGIAFAVLVGAVSSACISEFMKLVRAEETVAYKVIGLSAGISFSLAAMYESSVALQQLGLSQWLPNIGSGSLPAEHSLHPFYILPIFFIMLILIVPLILQRYKGMSARESFTIFGVLYFGWFLAHIVFLRNSDSGFGLVILLCMTVVANDVFAYAGGRLFGRTKVAPLISPKKTREGAITGFAGSIIAALLFSYLLPAHDRLAPLIIGAIVGITAPLGDLIISVVKRDVGVKDSSDLIPGHGGILDRCGSFVFASPVYYYYLRLAGLIS